MSKASDSLKKVKREHTITLRKPDALYTVKAADCWHEGIWLYFRVKNSSGSKTVHKVPPSRVVGVSWVEEDP